jgi:hypothetical protein
MTKLTQWLFFLTLFVSVWLAVILGYTPIKLDNNRLIWVYLVIRADFFYFLFTELFN